MDNKKILRNALPFIIIFFISLTVALYSYIQHNLSGARAENSTVSVSSANLTSPLATDKNWEWNVIATLNQKPSEPIPLTYVANWCLSPDSSEICLQNGTNDFFYQIGSGTLTVNARETISRITHQSVNCGRVDIHIMQNGQLISRSTQSTKQKCSKSLASNVGAYAESPTEFTELLNIALKFLAMFFGGDDSTEPENPSGGTDPVNPGGGGSEPPGGSEPGTPPSNPGSGDICTEQGATCKEPYREACTQNGQPGTRVCYKYGTCSGPGSGVQCSWGDGSFCDPCEAGTSVSDPLPPMKPPQSNPGTPPGNPGGGGGQPQPPAPRVPEIPRPSDANAQMVVLLADHIQNRSDCTFVIFGVPTAGTATQYNVAKCVPGFSGSRNDKQAMNELDYSTRNFGAGQVRGGRVINFNHLQCVGFVEAAVAAATGTEYNGPRGNAGDRCTSAGDFICLRLGQNFRRVADHKPAPNDLAVWGKSGSGPYGHIAYVIATTANTFTVLEANQGCAGCVRVNTYVTNSEISGRNFAGFLRKK